MNEEFDTHKQQSATRERKLQEENASMLKTMQAQRENQEKTMDLQSMQDTSQFDLVEKLRDVEALLDPET